MLADSNDPPIDICPPGRLRGDALRALDGAEVEIEKAIVHAQRRARELDLVVHPQRLERVRELLVETREDLRRNPR